MDKVVFEPIGVIRSPFVDVEGTPIQPMGAAGVRGTIELRDDLVAGLKDLDGFSHIMLFYWFHLSKGYSCHVLPFLDKNPRGVFATRVPRRPNGIGLSIVRLVGVRGSILDVEEIDVVDGTPLLDIKPYVPQFDVRQVEKAGWFTDRAKNAAVVRADRRFADASDEEAGCESNLEGSIEAQETELRNSGVSKIVHGVTDTDGRSETCQKSLSSELPERA